MKALLHCERAFFVFIGIKVLIWNMAFVDL